MILLDTTNEIFKHLINRECDLSYNGQKASLYFQHELIRTSKAKQIKRKNNKVVIVTQNSIYTLEDYK